MEITFIGKFFFNPLVAAGMMTTDCFLDNINNRLLSLTSVNVFF